MNNTIILWKNEQRLTSEEWKKFSKGDTIWGNGETPEEVKRWDITDEEEAKKELRNLRCSYEKDNELYNVTEYALEYCEYDEDGNFVCGSDYDLAEEVKKIKIYGVCNRLSYEHVYVFQDHAPIGEPHDVFEVELPNGYEAYENVVGDTIISSPYGLNYFIYECFKPGKEPVLYDDTKSAIITKKVKYTKLNEKQLYNAEYL